MVDFKKGDRVRHVYADLTGTVMYGPKTEDGYVKVRWDHTPVSYAALGDMYDLQRASMLERV